VPTIVDILTDNDSGEPVPLFVKDSILYISELYGGNPDNKGSISKLDLSTGTKTSLSGWLSRLACWGGVVDLKNNKIYIVGESDDENGVLRATLIILDLSSETVSIVRHPSTGDCNELVAVALDYRNNRLIVGERQTGGDTTGSDYPNGAGLWVIPLDDPTDTSKWSRVYEDPDGSEWRVLAIYGDELWAAQSHGNSAKNRIIKAPLNDLTSWTVVESYNNNFIPGLSVFGKRIGYVLRDDSNNIILKHSTDGQTWSSITLESNADAVGGRLQIFGKYALVLIDVPATGELHVYIVDLDNNQVVYNTTLTGVHGGFNKAIIPAGNALFFGYGGGATTPGYIKKLEFDTKYVLELDVSPPNPSPGTTVTLTATLKDTDGNPVQGATIHFFAVHEIGEYLDHNTVEYIGNATTDSEGKASIKYTIPSDAKGKIWFRAVYEG